MAKTWELIKKESSGLKNNIAEMAKDAVYGPVGIISNPIRFFFYAAVLGASQMLVLQVFNGAINKAMDETEKP